MITEATLCLAMALYHEARNQDVSAQIAVGHVVLNRVASNDYPSSICGVVTQGGEGRFECQFTFYCDGKSDSMPNEQAKLRAIALSLLIENGLLVDTTNSALFYHADYAYPNWDYELTTKIGNHLFYR